MKNTIRSYRVFVAVFDFTGIASMLGANVLYMADRFLSAVSITLGSRVELAPIPLNR